jgi:hypothetical protein
MDYSSGFTVIGGAIGAGIMMIFGGLTTLWNKGYIGFKIGVKIWLPYRPDWGWKWSYKHKGDGRSALWKDIKGLFGSSGVQHSEAPKSC